MNKPFSEQGRADARHFRTPVAGLSRSKSDPEGEALDFMKVLGHSKDPAGKKEISDTWRCGRGSGLIGWMMTSVVYDGVNRFSNLVNGLVGSASLRQP